MPLNSRDNSVYYSLARGLRRGYCDLDISSLNIRRCVSKLLNDYAMAAQSSTVKCCR